MLARVQSSVRRKGGESDADIRSRDDTISHTPSLYFLGKQVVEAAPFTSVGGRLFLDIGSPSSFVTHNKVQANARLECDRILHFLASWVGKSKREGGVSLRGERRRFSKGKREAFL